MSWLNLHARRWTSPFAKNWLLLAHESQLADAGSYVAAEIAGYPLLALRDEQGVLRAFHNVCRHRAGPLVEDGSGRCEKTLRCRYHGWAYAFDGRLASARDFGPASDFDPRDFSLFSLRCESWRGLVFINIDANAPPLAQAVAPLETRLGDNALGGLHLAHSARHTLKCNWKTYVENYLEGYHIPLVHPALNSQVDTARYEVEVAPPAIFHHAPPRDGAAVTGLWAWLWPCLAINLYAGGVLVERMWPLAYDRMVIDYLFLSPTDTTEETLHEAIAASLITTQEDIAICEAVQRNLVAGVYRTGRLSPRHEQGVAWFQAALHRALG